MAQQQIKSKQRVAEHGEVMTAEREVNAMLDLVKQETERVDSRFLEPACGDGNFLAEILRRKLEAAKRRATPPRKKKPLPAEFEKQSVIAITSVYGVDILMDNVLACRERLYQIWNERYEAVCGKEVNEDCRAAVRFILSRTVISRADYDAMAGQLAASMAAEAPKPDDIPDRPVFTNIGPDEEDEDEMEPEQPQRKNGAARTDTHSTPGRPPIVQPSGTQFGARTGSQISGTQTGRAASGNQTSPASGYQTNRPASGQQGTRRNGKVEIIQPAGPAIGNTYRPAYIPPKPSVPPTSVKPKATVDTSNVSAGTIVTHKAFGTGHVKGIDGGLIVVTFNGTDKKFQFPGAFEQGFLKI